MNKLELKVPPGVLWLVTTGLMWWSARVLPSLNFAFPFQRIGAIGVAATGLVIGLLGVVSFRAASTTVNPLTPAATSTLVVSGIYRFSRNPMYLGMLLLMLGWAIHLGNLAAIAFLPLFVAYMNRFQIVPEERALTAMFGGPFTLYLARVRRW